MSDWKYPAWSEVLKIKNGRNQRKVENSAGKYPIYGSGGIMGYATDYLCEAGTTVLGRKGSINKPIYVRERFWNVDTAFGLEPGPQLDNRYFYYFCKTYNFSKHNRATTLPSLTKSDLQKIKIPLPSLSTQQQIARILDQADDLRKKTQQVIDLYDQLAQSLFLDMFGDPVRNPKGFGRGSIRDLVSEVKYGTSSKADTVGDFAYLRMNNITYSGHMNFSDLKYISLDQKELSKYSVKRGDILFNRTNSKELVGKTAVYNRDDIMVIAGYIIRVRMNDKGNPYFVWAYLNSRHGKLILKNMCKNIVGMANINAQELQDIKILLPPITLQNQFAEKISLIEKQKELAKQSLQESENLFNALLQKAYKGELVNSV